jgi:NADPH:quinone reductase-like Zn-dependent oxidoreductase
MSFDGPEALQLVDIPERHAGAGEVRVRVHAATVNPTDTYHTTGGRGRAEWLKASGPPPYVPGMDVAGVLDEIGDPVDTALRVGDHVMAIVGPRGSHGGYSSSLVLPVQSVAAVPNGVDDVTSSTLPMNGLTARLSLDLLALTPGDTLLVTGAAGAYGGYVVQLAKADGLRVIADASEADDALVRSLGADEVVRRGPDVAVRVREVAADGVDGVADGSIQRKQLFAAVRDGGGFAMMREFDAGAPRDIKIHQVSVVTYAKEQAKLDHLRRQVEAGQLTLRVAQTFAPADAVMAHQLLMKGGVRGRLVLEF